jgi:hypothetical protein
MPCRENGDPGSAYTDIGIRISIYIISAFRPCCLQCAFLRQLKGCAMKLAQAHAGGFARPPEPSGRDKWCSRSREPGEGGLQGREREGRQEIAAAGIMYSSKRKTLRFRPRPRDPARIPTQLYFAERTP